MQTSQIGLTALQLYWVIQGSSFKVRLPKKLKACKSQLSGGCLIRQRGGNEISMAGGPHS